MKSGKTINGDKRLEAIRQRMIAVRFRTTGKNRSAFARKLGLSVNRWNNYEHGYSVPLSVILEIMDRTGVTAGYLIDGDPGGLTQRLATELTELEAELFASKAKRS